MSWIQIQTDGGAVSFRPGEEVSGTVSWFLDAAPESLDLRLFWYTEGKGDQDVEVIDSVPFEAPGTQDSRAFRVRLPEGPYSFSGQLISLIWCLEAVAKPTDEVGRLPITVSPTGQEIVLRAAEPPT
jgi:hypothetical protein